MKYLKYFENSNDYYTEISIDDHNKALSIDDDNIWRFEPNQKYTIYDDFTDNEIFKVLEFYPNKEWRYVDMDWIKIIFPNFKNKSYIIVGDDIIFKRVDSWYYIRNKRHPIKIFKCDGFEGLIKFLKDRT